MGPEGADYAKHEKAKKNNNLVLTPPPLPLTDMYRMHWHWENDFWDLLHITIAVISAIKSIHTHRT